MQIYVSRYLLPMNKNPRGATTNDWFIAVEGGFARLAICYCCLITGEGQFEACLALHLTVYPSSFQTAIAVVIPYRCWLTLLKQDNVSIALQPRNRSLKVPY